MIAREQQFAEKIHAYTLPRNSQNSRVKDLVDLTLLIGLGELDQQRILDALGLTFERRGTHELSPELASPPADYTMTARPTIWPPCSSTSFLSAEGVSRWLLSLIHASCGAVS